MYLIETNNLTKRYGHVNVVDHVNMHIPESSIYGFVGENGSAFDLIIHGERVESLVIPALGILGAATPLSLIFLLAITVSI